VKNLIRRGRKYILRIKKKTVVQGTVVLMVITMSFVGGVKVGEKVEYRPVGKPTRQVETAPASKLEPTYTLMSTRMPYPTLGSYPGPVGTDPYPMEESPTVGVSATLMRTATSTAGLYPVATGGYP